MSAISTDAVTSAGHDSQRIIRWGSREVAQARGTPIATHRAWRRKIAYESPYARSDETLEALRTISKPSASSSAETPSTMWYDVSGRSSVRLSATRSVSWFASGRDRSGVVATSTLLEIRVSGYGRQRPSSDRTAAAKASPRAS